MSDTSQSTAIAGGPTLATTTVFMVASALVGLFLFLFVFAIYLHSQRCYGADPISGHGRAARRLVFVAESSAAAQQQRCGLEPAAIEALPSVVFTRAAGFEEGVAECPVCISELEEGEAARVLPRCGHVFHRECIDMWLYSHSTCPLCRNPVAAAAAAVPEKPTAAADPGVVVVESSVSSHQERISSSSASSSASSSGTRQVEMVIEIPTTRAAAPGSDVLPDEEVMSSSSTAAAAAVAIRSLRRMLSRGSSRMGGASPREGADVEQGRPASKAPTSSR